MEYLNNTLKCIGKPVSGYRLWFLAAACFSFLAAGLLLYLDQRQASQVFSLAFMVFGLAWLIATLWGEERIEILPWPIRQLFILLFALILPLATVFLVLFTARSLLSQ